MKWEKCTLNDICDKANGHIQTGPFGSQLHQSDYSDTGTPVVMPKDIINGKISEDEIARVEDQHVLRLSRHKVNAGDILFSRRGDVGRCAYISEKEAGWLCGTGCLRVTVDAKIADSRFVFYCLQQPSSVEWIEKHAIGATMLNLNTGILASVPLLLPDLPTQRRIASILSAYDDLIENNRRQIKLLEEAAQRLYREWFVELRFPGCEDVKIVDGVPEGWQVVFLGDVIEFDPKVPLPKDRTKQSVPMAALSTSSMVIDQSLIENTMSNSGSKFRNGDTLLARITPCLENGKTAFVDFLDKDESAVGSTEFIVMRSKILNPYMVYCIARSDSFRTEAINSMTGSDGRQRAQKDKLKVLSYLLPKKSLIDRFEQFMRPCFEKIRTLNRQISILVEARDKLLPKLMSGEVEQM